MPLSSPEGPYQARYTVSANSVDKIGEYPVTFDVAVSTDNIDAEGVPEVVQQFVDLIASSPDFVLRSAGRTSTYSESMTPTA
ncbi:hypothetical protein [Streptomyces sp. NPDC058678]|uniref:hypothetical protein n=1 Tax=Streptomyces sp. NPDC058678 TaxID=3346595 RepID=UPI00365C621F